MTIAVFFYEGVLAVTHGRRGPNSQIASFPSCCFLFTLCFCSIFAATARRASARCAPCFRRICAFVPHVICWKQQLFSGHGSCAYESGTCVSTCCSVTSPPIPAGKKKIWWTWCCVTKALRKRMTMTRAASTRVPCIRRPLPPHNQPQSCLLLSPLRRSSSAGVIALIPTRSGHALNTSAIHLLLFAEAQKPVFSLKTFWQVKSLT